jgi:hypothetical protein
MRARCLAKHSTRGVIIFDQGALPLTHTSFQSGWCHRFALERFSVLAQTSSLD